MSNLETVKTYGLFSSPKNKKLISQLQEKGENVLIFPTLITERIELTEATKNHLNNLGEFDWLIFTDVYSVDYFIEALRELAIDLFELDALTIFALGEAVADRLRFVQIHADVIPTRINSDAVFSAISDYSTDDLEDLRFLLIGEIDAKFKSFELLVKKTVIVKLPVYLANFADEPAKAKKIALLKGGAVDEFIFSSAEDLLNLKYLFHNEYLTDVMNDVKISATAETAYQSLLENGLRPLYFNFK
ncbi:MAG: uroporphyrinogen-III synthase [Actinomycetota bacterium]